MVYKAKGLRAASCRNKSAVHATTRSLARIEFIPDAQERSMWEMWEMWMWGLLKNEHTAVEQNVTLCRTLELDFQERTIQVLLGNLHLVSGK